MNGPMYGADRATRQTQKDAVLYAVGSHVAILERSRCPMPSLSEEERELVKEFLNDFIKRYAEDLSID